MYDSDLHYGLVNYLKELWMPGKTKNPNPRVLTKNSEAFRRHFDQVQEQLETLASMDDLLSLHAFLHTHFSDHLKAQ